MSVEQGWKRGDPRCCTTLYTYYVLKILVQMSEVTGRKKKASEYFAELDEYKDNILKEFYNEKTGLFDDGSQFAQSFAIKLDIIPDDRKAEACDKLVENIVNHHYHLSTGMLGSKYVMEVLSQNGFEDVAMKLLLQPSYPGWMDLIKGKTTISEKWDGSMSQNHCMFGSVDAVLYFMLGGISIGENIIVKPYFAKQVNHVKCSVGTVRGMVAVEWERSDSTIKLSIECPKDTKLVLGDNSTMLNEGKHTITI